MIPANSRASPVIVSMPLDQAKQAIADSLLAVPTLSIVLKTDDMFGTQGIYSNPENTGERWERATSVELLQPDGSEGFQIDAGIRIQGGAFRSFGLTKKNSLRLVFKTKYGPDKLRYPLFGPDAVDEFDTVTLRMESNDGWQWGDAGGQPQYARDEFLRRTQLAMGQPASHGTSMHVYINGFYWGLYNLVERPDQSFGACVLRRGTLQLGRNQLGRNHQCGGRPLPQHTHAKRLAHHAEPGARRATGGHPTGKNGPADEAARLEPRRQRQSRSAGLPRSGEHDRLPDRQLLRRQPRLAVQELLRRAARTVRTARASSSSRGTRNGRCCCAAA